MFAPSCLALSLLLMDFGTAVSGRDTPTYIPRAAQTQPSSEARGSVDLPRRGLELEIAIRPYFLGSRHGPRPRSQEGPKGTQNGFKGPQCQDSTNRESNVVPGLYGYDEPEPDMQRLKRKSNLNIKNSVGEFMISFRIEDVNQIWGYVDDHTENSFVSTETKTNKYDESHDATTESSDGNRLSTTDTNGATTSSMNTEGLTPFGLQQWLNETIPLNESESSNPTKTNESGQWDYKEWFASQLPSNAREKNETPKPNNDFSKYGLDEFIEFLNKHPTQKDKHEPNTVNVKPLGDHKYHTINQHNYSTNDPSQPQTLKEDEWYDSLFTVPDNIPDIIDDSEKIIYSGPKQSDLDERFGRPDVPKATTTAADKNEDIFVFKD